ncbi:MAG: ATP-binding protein [bacterium]|nr:ATP-binding protein [bacterium]
MEKLFEEWTEYAMEKELKERDISFNFLELARRKIILINGIRRSGKSSLMMISMKNLPEKSAYINLEDERLPAETETLDSILRWFGDKGYLFLDEITSVKGWEGWLARVHEQTKGKLKIIAASSIRMVSNISKPLRGRVIEYELFPLSIKEFLSFKNIKIKKTTAGEGILKQALREYLVFGGYPEVAQVNNETDKTLILLSYFRDIVALDIAEKSKSSLSLINMVTKYMINSTLFSASKCTSFLKSVGTKIGKAKVLELERTAELSYLFFFAPIFSFNVKDRFQYPRKIYPGDTGFIHAVSGERTMGRIYESAVFLSLRRNLKLQEEISYWKDRNGYEVDFVIRKGLNVESIIQVSLGQEIKEREFRAGIRAAKEFRKDEVILIGDNEGSEQREGVKFKLVPIMQWLLSPGGGEPQ